MSQYEYRTLSARVLNPRQISEQYQKKVFVLIPCKLYVSVKGA